MTGSNKHLEPSDPANVVEIKLLSVRKLLRNSTHDHHSQLNHHPLLAGLTQSDYPLATYQKLLCAYFQIYQHLENTLHQFLLRQPCSFDYARRVKLPWLKDDLAFFNPTITFENAPPVPIVSPEIDNLGQLIGVLYAIEGSTLGGQLISRKLADHHGLTSKTGARFFNAYGEQTLPFWQEFNHFAETIIDDDKLCRAAVTSASQTFQFFNQMLDAFISIKPG